ISKKNPALAGFFSLKKRKDCLFHIFLLFLLGFLLFHFSPFLVGLHGLGFLLFHFLFAGIVVVVHAALILSISERNHHSHNGYEHHFNYVLHISDLLKNL